MSRENVEVIRRLYEAIARRDSEAVLDLYDPDVEWDMSGYPYGEMLDRHSRGHAGLRTFWKELYEAWESYEHEVHELIDAGNHVISIVTDRARGRASGAEVEIAAYGRSARAGSSGRCGSAREGRPSTPPVCAIGG